ncbi:protein bicaudal C homolog 1-like [Lycorma delicatula]|uniref:protein bicaudal C homolog 1-like n=1 Tax=Lycorma delicatula TaxID=130591 RepID=UPI003F512417
MFSHQSANKRSALLDITNVRSSGGANYQENDDKPYPSTSLDSTSIACFENNPVEDVKGIKMVMKIDLNHKLHSHFIGSNGSKIKKINEKSECKILFPNNRQYMTKSNSVMITGDIHGIERARSYIRKSTPLLISFPIKYITVEDSNNLLLHQHFVDLQSKYKVKVGFYCNSLNKISYARVTGTEENEINIMSAALELIKMFHWDDALLPIEIKLEIPYEDFIEEKVLRVQKIFPGSVHVQKNKMQLNYTVIMKCPEYYLETLYIAVNFILGTTKTVKMEHDYDSSYIRDFLLMSVK